MYFLSPNASLDYQLLDCGKHRKLERFGDMILDRPEISANYLPSLPEGEWGKADWHFYEEKGKTGIWTRRNNAPDSWNIKYKYKKQLFSFLLKITSFKHIGIFPEQTLNWNFIQDQLGRIQGEKKVLNLFAYTGIASIVAAKSNAQVTNVDSVKQVVNWGKENAQINGNDSIRWIQDDVRKFVDRAIRRKEKYQGIILDPPTFGYGLKNQKWIIERDLIPLLEKLILLLDDRANFFVLNTYSPKMDFSLLNANLKQLNFSAMNAEKTDLGVSSSEGKKLSLGNLVRFWH